MAVASGIRQDARVRKTATAVAGAGHHVTLLYARGPDDGRQDPLDGVTTAGLTVRYEMREAVAAGVRPRDPELLLPGTLDSAEELDLLRRQDALDRMRSAHAPALDRVRARIRSARLQIRGWEYWAQQRIDQRRAARAARHEPADGWRDQLPAVGDLTAAFTRALWRPAPAVVHVHDIHLLEAGTLAVERLRRRGRRAALIYDAHEYVAGMAPPRDSSTPAAWQAMEAELIGRADAVVTVSEPIADALQERYGLPRRPIVALNTPVLATQRPATSDVRTDSGVAVDVPLLVYSGVLHPRRGLATAVRGLVHAPRAELAVVAVPGADSPAAHAVLDLARDAGVEARVHLVDPVAPEEVPSYLSTADLGIHPLIDGLANHAMALPNKLFDYLFGGLPVVVSDLPAMGEFVRSHGVGTTFTPQAPEAFGAAVQDALARMPTLRERVQNPALREEFAWERQAEQLRALYDELLAGD